MERSALHATILEKCQIYLGSGAKQFERRRGKKKSRKRSISMIDSLKTVHLQQLKGMQSY